LTVRAGLEPAIPLFVGGVSKKGVDAVTSAELDVKGKAQNTHARSVAPPDVTMSPMVCRFVTYSLPRF
jgi:hypothetical protein